MKGYIELEIKKMKKSDEERIPKLLAPIDGVLSVFIDASTKKCKIGVATADDYAMTTSYLFERIVKALKKAGLQNAVTSIDIEDLPPKKLLKIPKSDIDRAIAIVSADKDRFDAAVPKDGKMATDLLSYNVGRLAGVAECLNTLLTVKNDKKTTYQTLLRMRKEGWLRKTPAGA